MPPGATTVDEWDDVKHGPVHATRYFVAWTWVVELDDRDEDTTLKSTASNAPMGKLRVGHLRTDAEQARALAQALLAAADEYEQMAGYDQITVS